MYKRQVSDNALVTPGTLTVALDTSDAPQAMQDADGNLTGYAVDVYKRQGMHCVVSTAAGLAAGSGR